MTSNPFETGDTPVSGTGIDLTMFDDDFAEAEAPEYEDVPDGKYQARICRAALSESRAGDPMIKWDLAVISGPQEGRHVFKNAVITRKAMPFIKADLIKLGLELGKISELERHLPELLDKTVEVVVKTRGEYRNVYFDKLISLPATARGRSPIPF